MRTPFTVWTRSALLLALLLFVAATPGTATFSITAVDPGTGQVGSAGASCISGSIILSDVHPGVGCVHTQAYWNAQNQQYARTLMNQGYPPEAIVDSLIAHDAQGNPTIRQYGIVDLVDEGRSAAHTGVNCTDWKGHTLAPTYAIQGNILLGPQIIAGMETAFVTTEGTLADRLMAALQAAKVPGADTRCLSYGKSSISAFLRVALPSDPSNDLYLDLNVNNTPTNQDPIDVLQQLYDEWKLVTGVKDGPEGGGWTDGGGLDGVDPGPGGRPGGPGRVEGSGTRVVLLPSHPNPFTEAAVIAYELPRAGRVSLRIFDLAGREVAVLADGAQAAGLHEVVWRAMAASGGSGLFFCRLEAGGRVQTIKMLRLGF